MTFFDFEIDEKDLASAKFIGETRRGLVAALIEAKKENPQMCQAEICRLIGMDKAVLSRMLKGNSNITLRTIGEVAWALGLEPEVHYAPKGGWQVGNNADRTIAAAVTQKAIPQNWNDGNNLRSKLTVKSAVQKVDASRKAGAANAA